MDILLMILVAIMLWAANTKRQISRFFVGFILGGFIAAITITAILDVTAV